MGDSIKASDEMQAVAIPPSVPPLPRINVGQRFYTTEQVAKIIGVDKKTVRNWRKQGLFVHDETSHTGAFLYAIERVEQLKSVYHPNWTHGGYEPSPTTTLPTTRQPALLEKRNLMKDFDRVLADLKSITPSELVNRGIVKPAPNHKDGSLSGYCCPLCHSGERGGTGAAVFDDDNRLYCHACSNADNGEHKLSPIDLYKLARNMQHESFQDVVKAMAGEFGIDFENENVRTSRRQRRRQPTTPTKANPAEIELIRADLQTSDESLKQFVESEGGSWRGLPFEFLKKFDCRYIAEWTPPKSRVNNKRTTPTPRILIPSSNEFYVARFCGNLDDFDESTQKFVADTQKLNAGSPKLFNPSALDSDTVIVVEGAIDALSLLYAGFEAVALNGRGNGQLLIDALAEREEKPRVVILMDSDEPGRKAAPKLRDALINIGVPCCVRYLFDETTKTDANDLLIRDGADNLRGRVEAVLEGMDDEFASALADIEKLQARSVVGELFQGDGSDLDFARRIEKFCGSEIRWATDSERWFLYQRNEFGGALWRDGGDKNSCLLPFAKKMTDTMIEYAVTADERKLAEQFKSTRKVSTAVTWLKGFESILITVDDINRHAELLNALNGVVDLTTGKLYPAKSELLIAQTVNAAYDAKADTTFIEDFFQAIQPDDMTRAGFLRWLGYCMSGETCEEKFLMWLGDGGNGKGVTSKTLLALLGSYGCGLPTCALLRKPLYNYDADKATTALNVVEGARFAISEELPQGAELDSSLTKNLTGGDKINLRKNYSEYRTIDCIAKINLSGNFVPRFEDVHDKGLLRRMLTMPFDAEFGTAENPANTNLKKIMLQPESLRGLLRLLVREAVDWYRDGLIVSDLMKAATEKNLRASDFIADFLNENYTFDEKRSTPRKQLLKHLRDTCAECTRYRDADLANMVAKVDGITYRKDNTNKLAFFGIGLATSGQQDSEKDEFDGEILSSADFIPPN